MLLVNFSKRGDGLMKIRELFWKQKEDEASDTKDEQEEEEKDEKKNPEIWWIYDGSGICIGDIALDATGSYSAQISKDGNNPYFNELITITGPLGSGGDEFNHSVVVTGVDKDELIDLYNNAGFAVVEASTQDHDEIIRELDKLQTVKGGESKKYK